VKPLIKREIKEFYIREPRSIIIAFVVLIYLFSVSISEFSNIQMPLMKTSMIYILPIAVFMLFSSTMLGRQFHQEIIERKIEILLGIGYSSSQIWFAKTITLCLTLYLLFTINLVFANIISFYMGNGTLLMSLSCIQIIVFLIFAPLTGLSIVAFMGFLLLITKDAAIVRYVPIILFGIMLFIFNKLDGSTKILSVGININLVVIFSSIIISICFIIIPFIILKAVKKERFII